MRRLHVARDFQQHAASAQPVGLNGSIFLICSRSRSVSENAIPGKSRALARFNSSPHSSQKNSSRISRYCAGERNAFQQAAYRNPTGGEMKLANGSRAVRQLQPVQYMTRKRVDRAGRSFPESDAVRLRNIRVVIFFRRRFVNRHYPTGVQRRIAIVVGQKEFRIPDASCANDPEYESNSTFPEQRDLQARCKNVSQITAVEPFPV